jgi:hypothetical protein
MNEKQKKVVRALEQFFENFRKKHGLTGAAVAKRAAGNKTKKRRS